VLEIARARRRLAKQFHPDVAPGDGGARRMHAVNRAWETLSDPTRRRAWDAAAAGHQRGVSPSWAPSGTPPWRYATAPTAAWRQREQPHSGHAAWWVLGATSLLLTLILIAGLVAALDGPSFPGRDSPVLQHNLDGPDQP
jgi:hypothetical protein